MEYYTKLLTFLDTAGGSILVAQLFNRSKTNAERNKAIAEAMNILGKTYGDVLDSLRKEVIRLEERLNDQEKREFYLRARIRELETEIHQLKNVA